MPDIRSPPHEITVVQHGEIVPRSISAVGSGLNEFADELEKIKRPWRKAIAARRLSRALRGYRRELIEANIASATQWEVELLGDVCSRVFPFVKVAHRPELSPLAKDLIKKACIAICELVDED